MTLRSPLIKIMQDAALKAGRGLIRDFGELEHLQVSRKGTADFVTSADLRAEKRIIETLQKARPDYSILAEESGLTQGKDKQYKWIIDPLDGTNNFMRGIPHFCTSIALEQTVGDKREVVAGVIYAPVLNEWFMAEKDQGAFSENRRLEVSRKDSMQEAMLASYLKRTDADKERKDIASLTGSGANVRVFGSAALELAYVAAGKIDGFWHSNLQPWDLAAGALIIQEAKGVVKNIYGKRCDIYGGSVLASNSALHDALMRVIDTCYKE